MCVHIALNGIRKTFKDTPVLGGINLEIEKGEIVAIFGPNGAGKTTLLNILAGVDTDFDGLVHKSSLEKIKQSYMFQNYRETLFHWRTGWENILLPHEIAQTDKGGMSYIKRFIHMIFPAISMRLDLDSYPYMYSGGQQQITVFLRSLVTKPNLLFIDEPFSALDYENNLHMRMSMLRYHEKYKPTIVFVTHSIEEAVHIADKIIVLSKKPSVVSDVISNNHGVKKDLNFIASPYFNSTKDEIIKKFRKVAGL